MRGIIYVMCALLLAAAGIFPAAGASAQQRPLLWGWWSTVSAIHNLSAYQTSGANIVVTPVYPPRWQMADKYLSAARQHHLQVLLIFPKEYIRSLNQIRETIRRYRGNPTIWGWLLFDEPDFWHVPATTLLPAYRAIKQLDSRPVVVNFMSGHCHFLNHRGDLDPRYLQTFDVLSIDHYVLFEGMPEFEDLGKEQAYYDRCVQVARQYHKLGAMIVLQAFGGLHAGRLIWRKPTLREEQYMTWMAERSGAMGITYFSDYRADRQQFSLVNSVIKANNRVQ